MSPDLKAGRRRPIRHTTRFRCQVVRERDFRLVADRVENLSLSGMLVRASAEVLTGERLIVSFELPKRRVWIDAEAVVARVVHGRRRGERGRALGLEFDDLDADGRLALACHLSFVPAVPLSPRAGAGRTAEVRLEELLASSSLGVG